MIDDRSFRDHWDFFDSCSFLRGYPQALPKILVSHGLGSLYAAILCSQRPGFFKASVSISPWLGMANTPSQFQLALLRAKALTSKASSLYQPIGPYLASQLVDQIPNSDKVYLHDRMTLATYLRLLDIMQEIQPHPNEQSMLSRVVDPQLFILPSVPHAMHNQKAAETIFGEHFAKIRNSRVVNLQGEHFDLLLSNQAAFQRC